MLVFNKRNILHQIRKVPGLKKTLSKTNQQLKHNNLYFQKLIQSIRKTKFNSGVLIKFPKKKQDLKVDLPTIGLDTFKDCIFPEPKSRIHIFFINFLE